jgi:hypothetical protein
MATTYYGSKDVTINYASTDITPYVDPQTTIEREAILKSTTPFGVVWPTWADTGSKRLAPLTFGGVERFETSTGCRVKFPEGTSGSLVVTYGGTKTTTVTCIVQKFKTVLATETLHVFEITLQPTGTVTEA